MESSLQIYLDLLARFKPIDERATKDKRQVLEEHGLNWDTFKKVEAEAIAEWVATGSERIEVGDYQAVAIEKPLTVSKVSQGYKTIPCKLKLYPKGG